VACANAIYLAPTSIAFLRGQAGKRNKRRWRERRFRIDHRRVHGRKHTISGHKLFQRKKQSRNDFPDAPIATRTLTATSHYSSNNADLSIQHCRIFEWISLQRFSPEFPNCHFHARFDSIS
jgi:hypothetical protein